MNQINQMKKTPRQRVPRKFCFACGIDNSQGMRLKFSVDPKDCTVEGTFYLAHRYQGPPSYVHGGVVAILVDEAMGKLNRLDGIVSMTGELTVRYHRPVPLGRKILVKAWPVQHRGRNYWRECTIHDSQGRLLVQSTGKFVKVAVRGEPSVHE